MNRHDNNVVVAIPDSVPVEHAVAVPNSLPVPSSDPVLDAVAVPNALSVSPVDDGRPWYRKFLTSIQRIEYESTETVGLCLLDAIEFMSPVHKNRLNIVISNKMLENTVESRRWLYSKSKFRYARNGGRSNNTEIGNGEYIPTL